MAIFILTTLPEKRLFILHYTDRMILEPKIFQDVNAYRSSCFVFMYLGT